MGEGEGGIAGGHALQTIGRKRCMHDTSSPTMLSMYVVLERLQL